MMNARHPPPSLSPQQGRARLWLLLLGGLGALCILLAGCGFYYVNFEKTEQYESAVRRVLNRYQAPGAVVGVWIPGDTPWRFATGVANTASGARLNTRHHFAIADITKSFTVTILLQLDSEQKLSLHDKIGKYVTGIPNGQSISLLQLAAMESGIQDYRGVGGFLAQSWDHPDTIWTTQQLLDFAIPESPLFSPGARYHYSSTNTILLGMVIERVTGAAFASVLRERILIPLDLEQTSYPDTATLPDPHPQPYEVDPQSGSLIPLALFHPSGLGAAGAMVSTLDDLHAWALALGKGDLLTSDAQALRLSHSRSASAGPRYDRYGLGIGMREEWVGHLGATYGFQSALFFDRDSGAAIVVLVNASPSQSNLNNDNIAEEIFLALTDAIKNDRGVVGIWPF